MLDVVNTQESVNHIYILVTVHGTLKLENRNWKFGDGSTRCDMSEIFMECAKRFEPMENPAQCIRQYLVGAGPRACPDNMQPQGKGQPQGVCPYVI